MNNLNHRLQMPSQNSLIALLKSLTILQGRNVVDTHVHALVLLHVRVISLHLVQDVKSVQKLFILEEGI